MRNKLHRKLQKDEVGTPETEETLRKLILKYGNDCHEDFKFWYGTKSKVIALILKYKVKYLEACLRKKKKKYWSSRNGLTKAVDSKSEATRIIIKIKKKLIS